MKNRKAKFRQPKGYSTQVLDPKHFHPRSQRESNAHIDSFLASAKQSLEDAVYKLAEQGKFIA